MFRLFRASLRGGGRRDSALSVQPQDAAARPAAKLRPVAYMLASPPNQNIGEWLMFIVSKLIYVTFCDLVLCELTC